MSESDTRPVSEIGKRLRSLRDERGLTVRGLAAASGVLASTINNLEVGRQQSLSPLRAVKLARALAVPPHDLIPELADLAA